MVGREDVNEEEEEKSDIPYGEEKLSTTYFVLLP